MVYRRKEYLAREQDAPTAMLPNKERENIQPYKRGNRKHLTGNRGE